MHRYKLQEQLMLHLQLKKLSWAPLLPCGLAMDQHLQALSEVWILHKIHLLTESSQCLHMLPVTAQKNIQKGCEMRVDVRWASFQVMIIPTS